MPETNSGTMVAERPTTVMVRSIGRPTIEGGDHAAEDAERHHQQEGDQLRASRN